MPRRSNGRRAIVAVLIGLLAPPPWAGAQVVRAHVDVGSARMRYADTIGTSTVSLSPAASVAWSRADLDLGGGLSLMRGQWTSQGSGTLAAHTTSAGVLSGEIGLTAGGSAHQDGARTGQSLVAARLYASNSRIGTWLGVAAGTTWDGAVSRQIRQGELGAWATRDALSATASLSPTAVGDTLRYTDGLVAATMSGNRLDLGATIGFRSGDQLLTTATSRTAWASATVSLWMRSDLAIVGGVGSYPVDLTQGFPGGRFVSIALRFGRRDRPLEPASASSSSVRRSESDRLLDRPTAFEVRSAGKLEREIRVLAADARQVEISGDVCNWDPIPLRATGTGWWEARVAITPGTHEIVARIDGGPWLVPPGLVAVKDDLGVVSGLLSIRPPHE